MMFGERYAHYYDDIYFDKNYERECDFLERVFRKYTRARVRNVLDISCGTGGHSIPLAARGYNVTAIDSSQSMIQIGRQKAEQMGCKVHFGIQSMCNFRVPGRYELCLSMFDSIDYLRTFTEIDRTFESVASHLTKGGIFVFQFWNKRAVKKFGVHQRHRLVNRRGLKIVRLTDSALNTRDDSCLINFRLFVIRGDTVIDDLEEKHTMRFFDPEEIKAHLKNAGLTGTKLLKPFKDVKANNDDWSVVAVTRKKGR
ncbi:MAG: methyltransferase domain-containing protein [Nitrososphaerota archaeon]|nr:methyltransferase domain-containing protein [Nitrososphaerota archaeon]